MTDVEHAATIEERANRPEPAAPVVAAPTKIFINYRRDDAAAHARLLYERLADRFGDENVFLDVVTMKPGDRWLDEIRSQSSTAGVFLALIGRRWAELITERAGGEEDHVRSEIEAALRDPGIAVIPTLLDGATMPTETQVPHTLRPLLRRNAAAIQLAELDSDVRTLGDTIETIASTPRATDAEQDEARPRARAAPSAVAPPPGAEHYDEVAQLMLDEASLVVPFLGPATNSSDRDEAWDGVESGYLPDSDELAAHLARKLKFDGASPDLARMSQYLWELKPSDLYTTLRTTLATRCPPGSVHRFLAAFPTTLERLGLEKRYQLIVTTNYDDTLERAFDDQNEPYDLAVYMAARGELTQGTTQAGKGRFLHIPHEGEPRVIEKPNEYSEFPISKFTFGLEQTIIVKIHGTVDTDRWRNNYVITEDDYIDFLSDSPIESIVPQQLRVKLKESQFLFIGYTMRDWNLRVFLQRTFGHHLPNNCWAIHRDPSKLDRQFWTNMSVTLFAVPLQEYVDELVAHLNVQDEESLF